jgi:hypothetical protein
VIERFMVRSVVRRGDAIFAPANIIPSIRGEGKVDWHSYKRGETRPCHVYRLQDVNCRCRAEMKPARNLLCENNGSNSPSKRRWTPSCDASMNHYDFALLLCDRSPHSVGMQLAIILAVVYSGSVLLVARRRNSGN